MTKEQLKQKYSDEWEKPVTMGLLLEYTDTFLMPRMSDLIDQKLKASNEALEQRLEQKIKIEIGQSEHRLKDYIDRKLAEYTSDIFKRLEKTFQKDKQFKEKVIELLQKHNIGQTEDLAYLKGLIA